MSPCPECGALNFTICAKCAEQRRDAMWTEALNLSHYDSIDGLHSDPEGHPLYCAECAPMRALLYGERAAPAAPTSPSDLSALKTEDQQELNRAAAPRSPRVGVALLVTDPAGTRVLLGRRGKEPNQGLWVVPGGGIECGETWRTAGVRELREEAGLIVQITSEPIVVELPGNIDHRVILAARASAIGGVPEAGDDLLEVGYFTADALPPITASAKEMLSRLGFTSRERAAPAAPSSLLEVSAAELRRDVLWREALADSCEFCRLAAAGEGDWCECTSGDCPLRALLNGNATPQATPLSLSDPAPPRPAASELNQGACGADSEETRCICGQVWRAGLEFPFRVNGVVHRLDGPCVAAAVSSEQPRAAPKEALPGETK